MSCVVYTSERTPEGRTIRYNLDGSTTKAALRTEDALNHGRFLEIPNERGGDPIFVNPDCVTSITPSKED